MGVACTLGLFGDRGYEPQLFLGDVASSTVALHVSTNSHWFSWNDARWQAAAARPTSQPICLARSFSLALSSLRELAIVCFYV